MIKHTCLTCKYLGKYYDCDYYFDQSPNCLLRKKVNIFPKGLDTHKDYLKYPFIWSSSTGLISVSSVSLDIAKSNSKNVVKIWISNKMYELGYFKDKKLIKLNNEYNDEQYLSVDFEKSNYKSDYKCYPDQSFDHVPYLKQIIDILPSGAVVAGSSAMTWFDPQIPSSDIDVFFIKPSNGKIKEMDKLLIKTNYKRAKSSPIGCINYIKQGFPNVQLIKDGFDSVDHILDSFDIEACQIALNPIGYYLNEQTRQDLSNKTINIHRWDDRPGQEIRTFNRILKYMDKGFNPSPATMKLIWNNKPSLNKAKNPIESPFFAKGIITTLTNDINDFLIKHKNSPPEIPTEIPNTSSEEIMKMFNKRKIK